MAVRPGDPATGLDSANRHVEPASGPGCCGCPLPDRQGKGPSIAEPDAALKAAMDYYAHQLSGLPQTQELLDTKEASVADSEAAIK